MKELAILGSTGSIGTQTLDVVRQHPDKFRVVALTAHQNDILLHSQIKLFQPEIAVMTDITAAKRLNQSYSGPTKILAGEEGILEAVTHPSVHTVVNAMTGFSGLIPTLTAISHLKNIALANKETLVAAGSIVMNAVRKNSISMIPIDSEHGAIFQCLQGEKHKTLRRLIVTASGGPFLGWSQQQLAQASLQECLSHPNWVMGKKITVDSASLANKGLEVIEAHWLFDVEYENIEVVVHPQSIIHSMVEFQDGSILAQASQPDMHLPIQYALSYPERLETRFGAIDFSKAFHLQFMPPDYNAFPALSLAYIAGKACGTMPCVFNAANEEAVYAVLNGKLRFINIPDVIEKTMSKHVNSDSLNVEVILAADKWARETASSIISEYSIRAGE